MRDRAGKAHQVSCVKGANPSVCHWQGVKRSRPEEPHSCSAAQPPKDTSLHQNSHTPASQERCVNCPQQPPQAVSSHTGSTGPPRATMNRVVHCHNNVGLQVSSARQRPCHPVDGHAVKGVPVPTALKDKQEGRLAVWGVPVEGSESC